ncbi:NUDIX hydrolase [Alicyclobacillus contaminans]|uniref:NUDIX hydrolase n=1 Tax=Alicyclobacillus contaminans TaxID=392016 RepID=UPI00068469FB|nr:CoA pyrophosphatase [Alicyclobacillus contaminans]
MSDAGISLHLPDIAASLKGRARGLLTPAETIRTAVMIPLLEAEDGVSVLFTKRARTLRRQPGEISFPGGHQEPADVDDAATALRETCEELGVRPDHLTYLGPLDVFPAWSGLLVYPHVAALSSRTALQPNPAEVEEVFTVPLRHLLAMQPHVYEVKLVPVPPDDFPYQWVSGGRRYPWREGRVEQWFYPLDKHVVWGLTARILTHFLQILRAHHSVGPCDGGEGTR